jgi:isoleucyl-tRNA synthetase
MADDGDEAATLSAVEVEAKVLEFWRRAGVPARSLALPASGPVFRFCEGPPTANGPPHLGHLIARILKDVQLRYRRQRGYRVLSLNAGWDCHGLGVEIEIEKRHGLRSRHDIEAFGVERFCEECRQDTLRVASVWQTMSERLGYWLDYEHPYRTMDAPYVESVWWSLRQLFDRGLLEKGHYVLPYCPRCETTLSSHEVAQGYHDATDPSVTVRFPLERPNGPERALLVWTTTPWTLPANLLVAVRADLDYVVVRLPDGGEAIVAEASRSRFVPEEAPVLERVRGSALVGTRYRPPFDDAGPAPSRYRIVADDFVTVEEGTGVVHVAPSFGPDDYRVGEREKVGVFDPLDDRGQFTDKVPRVAGKSFKAANPVLLEDLRDRGLLYRSETVRHTYPFCWRCDSALLYRAIDSWFVRVSRVSGRLVEANRTVAWIPSHLRDGRFGNFLTEAKDWALSRGRYWGTPLPIWLCRDGHVTCIGSFAELAERSGSTLDVPFDPHRVAVDRLHVSCRTCGQEARREPYTIDAWYDSGAASFARYHYPFDPGPFEPTLPLDYIAEGIDQTRGWYYTLLVLAVTLFDRPAYRACLTSGHVLDDEGRKMSKSKGNALDPSTFLEEVGADAARWGFLSVDFTEGMRVVPAEVARAARRTVGTLGHVVAFHLANAREDRLPPQRERPMPAGVLDRWLLSRLEATREAVEGALESFDPRSGALALRGFVDDLSTWYLRRSRPRFWGEDGPGARTEAHATLSYTLLGLARTISPLLPFVAEWTFQEVAGFDYAGAEGSVHLSGWPGPLARREPELEGSMDHLRATVELGRALRQEAGVKSRIPLAELRLFGERAVVEPGLGAEADRLLAAELNVRRIVRRPSAAPDELDRQAWVVHLEAGVPAAALPRRPTEELLEEGWFREIARRLQQRRKELHLRYGDRVRVVVSARGPLLKALTSRRETLARELLADDLELTDGPLPPGPEVRSWEFAGVSCSAVVRRSAGDDRSVAGAAKEVASSGGSPSSGRQGSA